MKTRSGFLSSRAKASGTWPDLTHKGIGLGRLSMAQSRPNEPIAAPVPLPSINSHLVHGRVKVLPGKLTTPSQTGLTAPAQSPAPHSCRQHSMHSCHDGATRRFTFSFDGSHTPFCAPVMTTDKEKAVTRIQKDETFIKKAITY
jgi:hypothetical protein